MTKISEYSTLKHVSVIVVTTPRYESGALRKLRSVNLFGLACYYDSSKKLLRCVR